MITSDVILASAAVPTLFRAVHLGENFYWDGLFAQNPPVRDLPDAARGEGKGEVPPNELWVIMSSYSFVKLSRMYKAAMGSSSRSCAPPKWAAGWTSRSITWLARNQVSSRSPTAMLCGQSCTNVCRHWDTKSP